VSVSEAQGWGQRWDEQQERYLPHREERFGVMLDVVEHLCGDGELRVLDLCCGIGSIGRRVLERFPEASIVAVDRDASLLEVGKSILGERVAWRQADVRDPSWAEGLEPGSFDAVLSATAIHWLQPDDVARIYRLLASLLRPGGVFANADHMPVSSPAVAELSQTLLDGWQAEQLKDAEDYYDFREAMRAEPALGAFVDERDTSFEDQPPGIAAPLAFHRETFLALGFQSADEVWRHHADAILVAIR
jgi:trans-aconitate methyltransferase